MTIHENLVAIASQNVFAQTIQFVFYNNGFISIAKI